MSDLTPALVRAYYEPLGWDVDDLDPDDLAECMKAMEPVAALVAQRLTDERERIAREIEALPTTRTKAWDKGWDSVSLADALSIARGGDDQ